MNGNISVHSELNKGSTFRIEIPVNSKKVTKLQLDNAELCNTIKCINILRNKGNYINFSPTAIIKSEKKMNRN